MDASQEALLVLRTLVALLAVVALAVLTIRFGLPWLLRIRGERRDSALQVEDVLVLDRAHRLYVVRWERARLLVGSSAEGLTVLSSSPAASGADEEAPAFASPPPARAAGDRS